jgi:hypothetical protein
MVSERMKLNHYTENWRNCWFWRTSEQQEIDYLEESGGVLNAYEFKWNMANRTKFSKSFTHAYPKASTNVITPENFERFLLE